MILVEQDHASMQNMIFGDAPNFTELMSKIAKLQDEINRTSASEEQPG